MAFISDVLSLADVSLVNNVADRISSVLPDTQRTEQLSVIIWSNRMVSAKHHFVVVGTLSSSIKFGAKADWDTQLKTKVDQFVPQTSFIKQANSMASAFTGRYAGQQIMDRAIYAGTNQDDVTISMSFTAYDSAWRDVVVPCGQILSLVYPEKLPKEDGWDKLQTTIPALKSLGETDAGETLDSLKNIFPLFKIPGPSPVWGIGSLMQGKSGEFGDYVNDTNWLTIAIGNLLFYKPSYLTSADAEFKTFDPVTGLPTSATCTISFRSFNPGYLPEKAKEDWTPFVQIFEPDENQDPQAAEYEKNLISSAKEKSLSKRPILTSASGLPDEHYNLAMAPIDLSDPGNC